MLKQLKVAQINCFDGAGGAERVMWDLFKSLQQEGQKCWIIVGTKEGQSSDVLEIKNSKFTKKWIKFWEKTKTSLKLRQGFLLERLISAIATPDYSIAKKIRETTGRENFYYPGSRRILDLLPNKPDIIHFHNLHGEYFDLRILPSLSNQLPVILTLHDTWLLTGLCYYFIDCPKWKSGCRDCPYLNYYHTRRDGTAYNWEQKRKIYAKSKVYVATPSKWLMDQVKKSILAPAIQEARVIHNGVDLKTFRSSDKFNARFQLGIPSDAKVLIFTAIGAKKHPYKDYQTVHSAVVSLAKSLPAYKILFIILGDEASPEKIGETEIRFVPLQKDPTTVAQFYQAADIYLHAAIADNFPNSILEALACGTPVVATAVGGIPEQIKSLKHKASYKNQIMHSIDTATGILVPPNNPDAMAKAVETLIINEPLRKRLGENAAQDARKRFNLSLQADRYLAWYKEITEKHKNREKRRNRSAN